VSVDDVATPLEFVISVSVSVPLPANVALAPDDGAEKVTATPLTATPFEVTVAPSGAANAVLSVALCPDPLVAVIAIIAVGVGVGAGVVVTVPGAVEDDVKLPQPVMKDRLEKTNAR
jgi:hypothetical protein